MSLSSAISIKTRHEIERMREAGRHVGEILLELKAAAQPGTTTGELDDLARRLIRKREVESSFEGYGPYGLPAYPAVVCTSINAEVVHGIPGPRELKDGDLLSIDFGVSFEGFHGDSALTVPVGEIGVESERLLAITRDALDQAIAQMVPGQRLSDIGAAVELRAEGAGFSVVRQFVGHGIGRALHEPPQIPNYGPGGRGPRLKPGMVFAIEPMVNLGRDEVRILDDQWTAVTADGSLSAHFEHTILITDGEPEVLTRIPGSH